MRRGRQVGVGKRRCHGSPSIGYSSVRVGRGKEEAAMGWVWQEPKGEGARGARGGSGSVVKAGGGW